MPARQMERAMAIWRDAERLLAVLPEHSHEAVDVRRGLAEARSAYVALSTSSEVNAELMPLFPEMINEAESAISPGRNGGG